MEEVEEGSDVVEAHLRGAGVGGIIAFFGDLISTPTEDREHKMIRSHKKISNDCSHAASKEKIFPKMERLDEGTYVGVEQVGNPLALFLSPPLFEHRL